MRTSPHLWPSRPRFIYRMRRASEAEKCRAHSSSAGLGADEPYVFDFSSFCPAAGARDHFTLAPTWSHENVSFNPSCIARFPPEPMMGLPVAKSGVWHPQPNELVLPLVAEGRSPLCEQVLARCGLE